MMVEGTRWEFIGFWFIFSVILYITFDVGRLSVAADCRYHGEFEYDGITYLCNQVVPEEADDQETRQ